MRKFTMLLAILVFIGIQVVNAQNRKITGTVTNVDDGSTLPGVSVSAKGTTIGTSTDINGKYQLEVSNDVTTLIYSFVGMKAQEITLGASNIIDVQLATETIGVDEVVVTALGISREKKSLGYASQGVKEEAIMATNDVNPISSLSGKVAGLTISGQNFAGSKNIMIRGASSFSGNNQPLFVVDGIPISNENFNDDNYVNGGGDGYDYGSMTNDLNSNDIANIEVLKGSAASALYGSRGQNGVIMITTKSGKKGKKSFKVEVNSGVNFDQVGILPELQTSYGGGYGFTPTTINGVEYNVNDFGTDESWGPKYDENVQVLHWWGAEDYYKGITSTPETAPWVAPAADVKDFYETGVTYQNSVNIISTAENSALRVGYTNVDMTGIVPNSSQQKHNLNINGSMSLFEDVIEINTNLNYANTYTKGRPQAGYGDNSQSQKFFQWGQRSLDFDKLSNYINEDGTQRTWNRRSLTDGRPNYSDNPYWTAYKNYQDDDRNRLFGKTSIKANITDYLFATGTIYLDSYTFNARERVSIGSQAMSKYSEATRQNLETNIEGKLNFKKNINDLSILAMIGGNDRNEKFTRLTGESNGGLIVDGLYTLGNSANQAIVTQYLREKQVKSWFGSASFGYKNFIYVDASYRKDYDSSLPNGNNSYAYSSVSTSLILSEFLDFDWMNNLKLRANYGETGNGTDAYSVFNTYYFGDPFNGSPQLYNSGTLNNPELVPEFTKEVELGLEGVFFNNRLGFDLSLYSRNTENQIVHSEVSGASGYIASIINAGKINNKGIEVLAFGTPVKTKDFSWDISINFAKNINEVKDLPEGLKKIQLGSAPFAGAYINTVEGATFQELYAYNYKFDDNGNKIIGSNGFYERGELESVGSVLPDYTAGIKNTLRYKNFDFSALIDISQGGVYYSLSNMWGTYSGMLENTTTPTSDGNTIREDGLVLDGVTEAGDVNTTNISAYGYAARFYHAYGTPSATSVFDASYIKLREVRIGYTLPKLTTFIQNIKVSAYGRNVATWGLDNKGIDPESIVAGSGNVQGIEGGLVPGTRSYGFNVILTF
ncbi:MAG: SusC/RagA family TonB-linked outer membrane protein [Bacteroidetes bacterium]|nr:SusC/RagA family TonB-linked outer membrane protein [Bacteroidota bacterium]